MSSRVNRKVQLIILLVLVCFVGTMSIAYAVLSTTLNINGTAQVQDASWNVHFSNVQVNPYSVDINPVITDNNKITFSADLTTPGDFYKFTVDIVNEGSIDAMIESIAKVPELTVEQKKYLRYEVEYVDGTSINDSQLLKSGETKTMSVLFSYRNDIPVSDLPSTETDFNLEIVLVYVQANNAGIEISGEEKVVKVVSGDLNTVGSEVCIGDECFYLMENDGESVTMLAKYNLHVGYTCITYDSCTPYGEEATGKQDSSMIGYLQNGQYPFFGITNFSNSGYWVDENLNLKNKYGLKYPAYVYDSNSTIYDYIERYKNYLEKNVLVEEARLIKLEELEDLGCSRKTGLCQDAPSWVYQTSYWSGSANDDFYIWRVNTLCHFSVADRGYNNHYAFGVRPVIEIPLTEF